MHRNYSLQIFLKNNKIHSLCKIWFWQTYKKYKQSQLLNKFKDD